MKYKTLGIIPARYKSTRLPGKPLADIAGKSMIQRVYEQASKVIDDVWVATDDKRIFDAVKSFGGNVIMTSPDHKSGTDRVAEAARKISENQIFDIVINIQGDEPFVSTTELYSLIELFADENIDITTAVKKIENPELINDKNCVKVALGCNGQAVYFSRLPIPFRRDDKIDMPYWQHIGLYGFRANVLQDVSALQQA